MTERNPNSLQLHFIHLAGEMAGMFSFNRSIGQIYGLLYASPEPLSLEAIAKSCQMSKGNASIHLRTLETWGAAHRSWKPGTRKDYYAANTDLKGLAIKRLQQGMEKRIGVFKAKLQCIKEEKSLSSGKHTPAGAYAAQRLEELESLLRQVESGFSLLPKLANLKRFL
jgi:DNA-binding transcriptional regulator GbsR (MarR family)